MIRIDRIGTVTEDVDVHSTTEEEEKSARPSMLYSVLPVLVSNRLPTISSLRQSLTDARRSSYSKVAPVTEIPQPETPPPGYSSRPGSGAVTPQSLSAALGEAEFEFAEEAERPGSAKSSGTQAATFDGYETSTGIRWRYASLGTSLMEQASRESSAPPTNTDEASTALTRQLYIHGMSYLLRGLPAELTSEEMLSLQAAMPQGLVEMQSDTDAYALLPVPRRSVYSRAPEEEPTMLHRVTATLVIQTFILIQFLLPYIKLFLSHAYQFERKHQITKRLVNTGVTTVDELGRKSLKLSQTVCRMNDGKVGQAINDVTIWWVRGVTGGVQQGLEEGLKVVRAEAARRAETVERME